MRNKREGAGAARSGQDNGSPLDPFGIVMVSEDTLEERRSNKSAMNSSPTTEMKEHGSHSREHRR